MFRTGFRVHSSNNKIPFPGLCDCRVPCRVTYRYLEDGTKVRVSTGGTASGSIIPRPAILLERRKPRPSIGST